MKPQAGLSIDPPEFRAWLNRPVYVVQVFTANEYNLAIKRYPVRALRIVPKYRDRVQYCREGRAALAAELRRLRRDGLDRHEVRRKAVHIIDRPGGGIAERVDIEAELERMK